MININNFKTRKNKFNVRNNNNYNHNWIKDNNELRIIKIVKNMLKENIDIKTMAGILNIS